LVALVTVHERVVLPVVNRLVPFLKEFVARLINNQHVVAVTDMPAVPGMFRDVAAPKLWNSVFCETRTAENLNLFKSKLKTHLFCIAHF